MRYIRIYADEAGESRSEEVDIALCRADFAPPAAPMDLSAPHAADRVIFATMPIGWYGERHTAPRRQFFFQLAGTIEWELSEGRRVRPGVGSVTLLEDTSGSGHSTRVIGDEPVTGAFVQLPD